MCVCVCVCVCVEASSPATVSSVTHCSSPVSLTASHSLTRRPLSGHRIKKFLNTLLLLDNPFIPLISDSLMFLRIKSHKCCALVTLMRFRAFYRIGPPAVLSPITDQLIYLLPGCTLHFSFALLGVAHCCKCTDPLSASVWADKFS